MAELASKWAEDVGVPPETAVLKRMSGAVIEMRQDLVDVGEVAPGAKVVTLKVEEAVGISVEIYARTRVERCRVPAMLTAAPHELELAVRDALAIPSHRHFWLRTRAGPLTPGVSLDEQGIEEDDVILVDLAFDIDVRDAWSGTQESFLLYSSDDCRKLLRTDCFAAQRLLCGRRRVEAANNVIDALLPFGALRQSHFHLRLDVQQVAMLAVDRQLKAALVWPRSSVAELLRQTFLQSESVMFDRQLIRHSARLSRVRLPEGGVLHVSPIALTVKTSGGRRLVVHVPDGATAAAVKEAVRSKEKETNFVLRRGRQELCDEDVVRDGDELRVLPSQMDLRVRMDDAWYHWSTAKRSIKFTDVMRVVSSIGHVPLGDLVEKKLHCTGCGRTIWKEEEAFQAIPAVCCRVQSMVLRERATQDGATQTVLAGRGGYQIVGVKPVDQKSPGVQAVAFWHHASTTTEQTSTDPSVGTDSEKVSASVETAPCVQNSPALRVAVGGRGRPLHVLFARPRDTLGAVVRLLRRRRLLMGVREMRVSGGGCLSSVRGWRERSLKESGADAGSELQVEPILPPAVRVNLFDPTRRGAVRALTVQVGGEAVVWGSVRAEAERSGWQLQSAVAVQWGTLYLRDGHQRRSIESYNIEEGGYPWLDEDDGAEVDLSQRTHFLLDVVRRDIATAPSQAPNLQVFDPSAVLRVSEAGELLPADEDALFDRRAVLLLEGLLLRDRRGHTAAMMLQLPGRRFVDALGSGAVHEDAEAATASIPQLPGGQWSVLWLVARAGARLPRYRLPADEVLDVLTRRGVEVAVAVAEQEGHVTAAGDPADVDGSSWIVTSQVSDLDEAVTRAMTTTDDPRVRSSTSP